MARAPALQAGGQGFDSLILHEAGSFKPSRVEARRPKFFDMMRREARRREEEAREYDSTSGKEGHHVKPRRHAGGQYRKEFNKSLTSEGARWMPWLPEAKKDVISHERPRRGASDP